ncbi:AdoMet-homocysteine methyltransferase [Ceratobasidium sp. 395]|nr:AdoMet-homocysteine methyltransferase [Ceratobasidium sp. 395]
MTSLPKDALLEGKLSSRFSADEVVLLDAGLGTTLEDVLKKDVSNPLWSAHLIESEPESIVKAHLAFLEAGSSIILTATYQCASETFARAGYTPEQGNNIMHKAISLAVRARDQYLQLPTTKGSAPKIALSLGAFGAVLSPAAEFTGIYPPPYGPAQPSTFFDTQESPDDNQKEQEAEDALAEFHFNRLRIFAGLPDTWNAIDIVAFETVPLLREARAIRRAMTLLANTNPSIRIPPWWISFNFAEGPLAERNPTGTHYTAADAVRACFEQISRTYVSTPSAFGVNCTHIKHIKTCLNLASQALNELSGTSLDKLHESHLSQLGLQGATRSGPALVVYPNGGRVYVPSTMTWLPPSPTIPELDGSSEAQVWARKLVASVVEGLPQESAWSGLIIGGCCKTEPSYLVSLKELF